MQIRINTIRKKTIKYRVKQKSRANILAETKHQLIQICIERTMDTNTIAEETIGRLDRSLNRQLNRVMHHEAFQRLESAWRGLDLLVTAVSKSQRTKVRFLHLPLQALGKELANTSDFEQSLIFKKIYTEELDSPGGEPFGLLIGDYYFSHKPTKQVSDPMGCLEELAKIAAAAFVPFVSSVGPEFFGLESFAELQGHINFERLFQTKEYHRWHRLRQSDNAHFLGFTLPRLLMRRPYGKATFSAKQRLFNEDTQHHDDYLWGNACYAYAAVVIKSYEQSGWFMNIRGASVGTDSPSMFDMPRDYFKCDPQQTIPKIVTECLITDTQEKRFNDAGFIAVRDHHWAGKSVFYSSQTVKLPSHNLQNLDKANAKINAMLHYVLCASRFAHYIKVIIRDKVGSFTHVEACETYVTRWLSHYCSAANGQSLEAIAKTPLTQADVSISEVAGSPGKFYCNMAISPHSQFDDIQSQLKLVTNVRMK